MLVVYISFLQIWQFSDENRQGFLSRQEFYNALKLVTVAQTGRELTPELVKAALNGPAGSQIPPPRINPPTPPPNVDYGQTTPRSYGHQFPAPGSQPRSPLQGTSSLPTGAQYPAPGLPRPAVPSSMLSPAASLPNARSTPAFQPGSSFYVIFQHLWGFPVL